jgi:hypothetical protein
LGYRTKVPHDLVMAVSADGLEAQQANYAPVAGKSTPNRLELGRSEATHHHNIGHNSAGVIRPFIDIDRALVAAGWQRHEQATHAAARVQPSRSRTVQVRGESVSYVYVAGFWLRPDGWL